MGVDVKKVCLENLCMLQKQWYMDPQYGVLDMTGTCGMDELPDVAWRLLGFQL